MPSPTIPTTVATSIRSSAKLLDESLRLLRTDHVDLYQFHALSKMSDLEQIFGPNGAMETYEAAKKAESCVSLVSRPTRWKWLFPQWIGITSTRFCSRLTLSFTPRPILDRKCSRRPGRRK